MGQHPTRPEGDANGLYLLAGMALVSAVSTYWLDIKRPAEAGKLAGVPAE